MKPPTALVIEDDKHKADLVWTILEKHGYEIVWTTNLHAARRTILLAKVDLVITDWNFPRFAMEEPIHGMGKMVVELITHINEFRQEGSIPMIDLAVFSGDDRDEHCPKEVPWFRSEFYSQLKQWVTFRRAVTSTSP